MSIVQPEHHEIETAAYYCFLQGGKRSGHELADWVQGERMVFLAKNYTFCGNYFLQEDKKQFIGDKTKQVCRYCQGTCPFRKTSHTIPEFFGNKSIVSLDECDTCNEFFGRSIDDHLGKFMLGTMNLIGVKGKKGVPTLTTKKRASRIESKENKIEITSIETDPMITWNPAELKVSIETESQPFAPLAAFKSLTKLSLGVMPQADLVHYSNAISWIRNPDHTVDSVAFKECARVLITFQPGPLPNKLGWVMLLKRRHPKPDLPNMICVLQTKNVAIQFVVPCCSLDNHWAGKQVYCPPYPAFYGYGYEFGEPKTRKLDLSSPVKMSFKFSGEMKADSATQTK